MHSVANGHLERIFSQMKLIKTTLRSSLDGDSLDHLLRINVEGPPLESGMLLLPSTAGGRKSLDALVARKSTVGAPLPHQLQQLSKSSRKPSLLL